MTGTRPYGAHVARRATAMIAMALLFLLRGMQPLGAQPAGTRILVGIGGEYERGWEWSRFPLYGSEPDCDQFTTGTIGGAGAGPRLTFSSIGGSRVGAMMGVSGIRSTGDFGFAPSDSLVLFVDETGRVARAAHEYHYRTVADIIRLDLLCAYAVSDWLDVGLGPSVGYRQRTEFTLAEDLAADGALRFPDGSRERIMPDGAVLAWRSLGLGMLLRGGGHLPMGVGLVLVPELSVRADLLSAVAGTDLRSVSVGASLALLYDLSAAARPSVIPPPVAVATDASPPPSVPPAEPIPAAPPIDTSLTASIDLYGLDEREHRLPAATIRVMETRRRLVLFPSRWVEFDAGSSLLPAMYRRSPGVGEGFTLDSLWSRHAPEYPLLDIVGVRMRESPAATLGLLPERRGGEPVAMGRDRAASIRRYLVGRWGIDGSRIVTAEPSAQGAAGRGARVLLRPEPPALLDSVVIALTTRDPDPPLIVIDPQYHAAAGVRRWTITLSYDGRQVGRYSSDDSEALPALNWQGAGESGAPLVADLRVEDSLGRSVSASGRLPLLLERSSRVVEHTVDQDGGGERLLFSMPPGEGGDGIIREIVGTLRDGARVTVGSPDGGGAARDLLRREADARGRRRVEWREESRPVAATGIGMEDLTVMVEQRLGRW